MIDYKMIKTLNEKAESRRNTDRFLRLVDVLTLKKQY